MRVNAYETIRNLDKISMATLVEISDREYQELRELALYYFISDDDDSTERQEVLRRIAEAQVVLDIVSKEIETRRRLMKELAERGELEAILKEDANERDS